MPNRIRYSTLPTDLIKYAKTIEIRYPDFAAHINRVSKAITLAELGADEKAVMTKLED